MASYKLTIRLKTEDVHTINRVNQKIIIVKEVGVDSDTNSNGSKVSWISFSPFENNEITWETEYGIYSSTIQIEAGAKILKTSSVNPASSGLIYPFETGAFDSPSGDAGSNNYGIENKYHEDFTFGMAQSAIVNGNKFDAAPLNAVTVLSQEQAIFTPIEKVSVFLNGKFNNGVIIASVSNKALDLDLTSTPSVVIHYDKEQGKFVNGDL
jgi:hypothetical protein